MTTPTVTITLTLEEKVTIISALANQYICQSEYAAKNDKSAEAYKKSAEQAKELAYKIAKERLKF